MLVTFPATLPGDSRIPAGSVSEMQTVLQELRAAVAAGRLAVAERRAVELAALIAPE